MLRLHGVSMANLGYIMRLSQNIIKSNWAVVRAEGIGRVGGQSRGGGRGGEKGGGRLRIMMMMMMTIIKNRFY